MSHDDTTSAGLVGLMAGIHAATWGMYKDAPHEGFSRRKYLRSPVLGSVLGVLSRRLQGSIRATPPTSSCCSARSTSSSGRLRDLQDVPPGGGPVEVLHPMQFHILGRVVRTAAARLVAELALYGAACGTGHRGPGLERTAADEYGFARCADREPGRVDQRVRRRVEGCAFGGFQRSSSSAARRSPAYAAGLSYLTTTCCSNARRDRVHSGDHRNV